MKSFIKIISFATVIALVLAFVACGGETPVVTTEAPVETTEAPVETTVAPVETSMLSPSVYFHSLPFELK